MSEIVSAVGLRSQINTDIEYKERAPLVIPGKADALPKPDTRNLSEVATNWPVDTSRQDLAEIQEFYKVEPGQPLSVEQMRGHPSVRKAPARQRDFAAEKRQEELLDGKRLSPDELQELTKRYREAKKQSGAEVVEGQVCGLNDPNCIPKRRYLTEPPLDYSTPVAGVAFASPQTDENAETLKRREEAAIMDGQRIDMSKQ